MPIEKKVLERGRLMELLHYNKKIGIFRWRKGLPRKTERSKADKKKVDGYCFVWIDGKQYPSHRLAWLYVYGYMPENEIDHINRVRSDNRISNLREVSRQCNVRNCSVKKNNKSGITGVCWAKDRGLWKSQTVVDRKTVNLGYYKSKLDAAKARWETEVRYGFPSCNTTSSALKYIQGFKHNE